jgi:hypothetical protein
MKKFVLILVLITINGCAVQQMSGGASNPSSPSSASGMPSPSMPSTSGSSSPPTSGGISMPSPSLPSGSQSSQSGSQSSQSGSSSSTSGGQSAGGNQSSDAASGNNSGTTGNASSNQGEDSQSGSGVMSSDLGSGQSASSIFDESLGDFDNEIAGERVIIAAANQTLGGMTSQERTDAAAVQQGGLDGPLDIESSESGNSSTSATAGQTQDEDSSETELDKASENTTGDQEKIKERIPDDIPMDGTGEDVIARQIREAAIQEEDPMIRAALWDEYRKHMGIKK